MWHRSPGTGNGGANNSERSSAGIFGAASCPPWPSNPDFLADDRRNVQHRNYRTQGLGCESCHGTDLRGTVLSRTAADRTVRCKTTAGSLPECAAGQTTAVIPKGTPVGCEFCHRQK